MNKVVVLLGPTAVGKTDVAIELAERMDAEVISSDSVQVYRYVDIGSAKPSPEQMERVRHHLISIRNPDEPFSSGDFVSLCNACIDDISSRGKGVIVVGGSGFYIDALLFGLDGVPVVDDVVFRYLEDAMREYSPVVMYRWLEVVDDKWAERISPSDSQRIKRGLGVFLTSGVPLWDWFGKGNSEPDDRFEVFVISTSMDNLKQRILKRTEEMVERGLVEETKRLIDMGYGDSKPIRSIGYKEAVEFILGKLSRSELIHNIARNTVLYARRQLTHFRSRFGWAHWIEPEGATDRIISLL